MANIYNNQRISFSESIVEPDCPDLLEIQIQSFKNFVQLDTPAHRRTDEGLHRVFVEHFPVTDARENFLLELLDYSLEPPRYEIEECKERGLTYAVALKAKLFLSCTDIENVDFDSVEQEVFLGNIPYMTPGGTFIINGAERVVVSQLHRSPGVFFGQSLHPNGAKLYSARILPFKGSWIEFSTDVNNIMYAYIDGKKKIPITTLLRAIGFYSDKDILELFDLAEEIEVTRENLERVAQESKTNGPRRLAARVLKDWYEDFIDEENGEVINIPRNEVVMERDEAIFDANNEENAEKVEEQIEQILDSGQRSILLLTENALANDYAIILNTLQKDNCNSQLEAMQMIYRQLRNAEAPDEETARGIIDKLFFSDKRYDLGAVGRDRLNKKLHRRGEFGYDFLSEEELNSRVLTRADIIEIVKCLVALQNGKGETDDENHLASRRVRTVGEQLYAQFSIGLARIARTIRERINIRENELFAPQDLINERMLTSVINSFFGASQLSQFIDQTNPLSELTHKRRISALGPGGLSREHAGFELRDVHYSHYGRLCPIETPEGPNIGLISSLSIFAKVNDMGFIETPYWKLGAYDDMDDACLVYLDAEKETNQVIADSKFRDGSSRGRSGKFQARKDGGFLRADRNEVDLFDVASRQMLGASASLIPFLEHDDAARALMGVNMQRQAAPLIKPEAPIVGTGMERKVAADSRALILAKRNGRVVYSDATSIRLFHDEAPESIRVSFENRLQEYEIPKFCRTNQSMCLNMKPVVKTGDRVKEGDVLAEGYSTEDGELALGRNLIVAYMPWQGYNFEEAIIISEKVVADDYFTSVNIEEFALQIRDTKLGPEELTREIPNVSDEATKNLDQDGLIRIGAEVRERDILIGKIASKGETGDPTPEEKLLRLIFGDQAGDVKDASLKAPPSFRGVIIGNKLFSKDKKDGRSKSDKPMDLKRLEKIEADMNDLGEELWKRLKNLLGDQPLSGGIYDCYGTELLAPGQPLSDKIAHKIFVHYLPYDWNKDSRKENELKRQLVEAKASAKSETNPFIKEAKENLVFAITLQLESLDDSPDVETRKLDDKIARLFNDYFERYREYAYTYKQLALNYDHDIYERLEKAYRKLEGLNGNYSAG